MWEFAPIRSTLARGSWHGVDFALCLARVSAGSAGLGLFRLVSCWNCLPHQVDLGSVRLGSIL